MLESYVEVLKKYISEKRIEHSKRVAFSGLQLAKCHNANQILVEKAGLLHDIAKNQTPESLKKQNIITDLKEDIYHNFPAIWHAFIGPSLIEYEFPGESKHISEAVKFHTTGNQAMPLVAKIIYVADFIEPGRTHQKREEIEKISQFNLDEAVAWVTYFSIKKLQHKNRQIHPYTKDCWDFYRNHISSKISSNEI